MKYAADRLATIKPSASVVVSQNAKALIAEGFDVIDLGLGEPDFDTPAHIVEAAFSAAKKGETRYPPIAGTAALKQAIAEKFDRDNKLRFAQDEIIVSNGVKQILFGALMASLEPGDEVLLCAPYFGSYEDIVLVLGGQPVVVACPRETGFKLTPEKLAESLSSNTRWLLLNTPCNPSGAVYTREELQALGQVLLDHPDVLILSDEIYEKILFDDQEFVSFAAACPQLGNRTLTANGVSKAYAMTGWRIGYGAGPKPLIAAMSKVQSQVSSGACSIAQAAAAAAISGPQEAVTQFRDAYERRRDLVVERIAQIPGLKLDAPGGAFYAYIDCGDFMGSRKDNGEVIEDDVQLARYLLDDAKVAVVPGSAYGLSPFFRISTAASDAKLSDAMDRIERSLARLKKD